MEQELSLQVLEDLRRIGLLVPMYRVDDECIAGRAIEVPVTDQSDLAAYARAGRLRDPADEGYSNWWPIAPPSRVNDERWWDGYYFSRWQLMDINRALNDLSWHQFGESIGPMRTRALNMRRESIAVSALAPRHLPGILGQISLGGGGDFEGFRAARFKIDDLTRIQLAGVSSGTLQGRAEHLLTSAHSNDPMIEWWPLIRHSDHRGWAKLKGRTLFSLWQRIAAEILLRSHEHLAESGVIDPLPSTAQDNWWSPLSDRTTLRGESAERLDSALGALGLSPPPTSHTRAGRRDRNGAYFSPP